ncbi:HIRAN domain-containing protein [Pseudobutyrivibrio sp.]|jgi:HipA-like protein|uniref:HIRAN domain-containing protein n=1 Tax=Pseudobutyrivibrio sp. TaxID=2014367 RepID=UPI00386D680A
MNSTQQKKKNNYLYLVWNNPINHSNYIVGSLYKEDGYKFKYNNEFLNIVKEQGIELLHAFPDGEKEYYSKELFPAFSSRLPDRKRRDIDKILEKYGLSTFDEFELLKCGGGKLPIDTYEFVDPIFPAEETISKNFYVMGVRYYNQCNGDDCECMEGINEGEELLLKCEPNNKHDKNAVQMIKGEKLIGYIPRYYSEAVSKRLNSGMSYKCTIIEVSKFNICNECIKVNLLMPRND